MKTELQEAGLDAENMVTTTSTLRDKLYGLTEGKVDIMVDDKTLKSTAQILRELSTAYNQLDDDSKKAAILELVAGKVQANVLASLLQNFDLAEKAMETSANSAGSALAENAKFLDSIVGKTQQFTNATENLWNNLISSDTVKWFIDQGTTVINFLDGITSKLGIIGTASIPLTLSVLYKFFKGFNLGVNESVLGMGSLSNATMALSGGLLSMIGYLAKVRPSFGALKGEIEGTSVAAQGLLALVKGIESIPVGGWIAIAVAAVTAITAAIIAFNNVSYKEHVDKLKESYKELTLIQQNIKDLNTEIETTQDRIEELQKLVKDGTISPVEKDELDELIRYNTELERQANIQKAAEKYKQKQTAAEFVDTYNSSQSLSNNGYKVRINRHGDLENTDNLNWFQRMIGLGLTGQSGVSWLNDKLKEYEQAQEDLSVTESNLASRRSVEGTSRAQLYDPLKDYEKRAEKAREKVDRIDDALYEAAQGWKDLLENQEYYYAEGDKELEEWQKKSNEAYKAVSAAQDKYLYTTAKTPAEKAMYRQQTLDRIFTTQASDAAKKVKELVDEGASREMILGAMRDMDQTEFQYFGMTSPSEIIDYLIGMAEAGKRATEEAQELAEKLEHIASLPSSIDGLTASFESYSKALDIVNTISSNNIALTEDQYKALNEYLGSEEEFAEAIDTSNGNLVKNKDVLVKLLDTKKKETQENLKLSRAQAKVAYAKLNNELKKVVTSTKNYNASTKNSVKSLKNQIDSVKNVIKQYDRLEDQLLGTYSAFDKFEDAKTADAATDYTSKVVDMLEAVDDGFKTAKVGSETFMSAMEGLVPPTIGINFEDPTEKIQAMYDYIYSTVAKYATIDEDDGISITMPNVKSFVEDAISAGVFSGSWENFDLINGKTIDDLVSGLNISEPLAYALLEGLSDYVIGGESILAQFDTSIEGRYTQIINKFANINEQYINSLEQLANTGIDLEDSKYQDAYNQYRKDVAYGLAPENTGTLATINQYAEELNISTEKYIEIFDAKARAEKDYTDVQSNMSDIYNESINSAKEYLDTEIKLAEAQEQYNDLYDAYQQGTKEDGTQYSREELSKLQEQINLTYDVVDSLQTKLNDFESIDIVSTLAIEGIDQRVEELQGLIDALELKKEQLEENGVSTSEVERSIEEAKDQISELNNTKIELNANYIKSNEGVIDSLEQIEKFKIGDKEFNVTIKNAASIFNQLKKFVEQQMKLDGATVHMSVQYDGSAVKVKQEEKGKNTTVLPTLIGPHTGTFDYKIEPKAIGQNNSLVGELGQELVVDPNKGKFYTVGDHGAEFADIPDDAIVFNHKQTKDLLTHGHTTRGRALAGGNAFANQTFSNYYTVPKNDSDDDDSDEASEQFEQTIDFIEYRFEELSQTIEQLNAKLENTVDLSEKNKLIDDVIVAYRQQLQDIPAAITVYSQKAAEELAKIPFEFRDKAMNGALEVRDFVGDGYEDVVKAIEDYRDFANKIDELNVQLEETRVHISESAIQKLENIQAKYEADDIEISASIQRLQTQIDYLEVTGEDIKTEFYEQIIPLQERELELLKQERQELETELTSAVNRGDIIKGSQAYLEQLQKIYDAESTVNEKFNEIAETNLKIAQTNFDNMSKTYENKMRVYDVTATRLQNQINLVEEQGDYVSSEFYGKMIDVRENEIDILQDKKAALKQVLDAEIAAGRIVIGSEPYYEMVDAIYSVDEALDDAVLSVEQFQNSINDLHWDNFDKLLKRLGYVDSEISHVYDLMSSRKTVDDTGNWTEEGITAIAMQAQAMEAAGYKAKQYAEQIEELNRTQDRYSDEEYTTKLNELIEGQWQSIDAYESAKDAIISLNKTRVDTVKDGIQKEIDAYAELLNLKKEELNASKELHDFEKNINEQQKSVSDLEKQIAARAGSTDAATIAERKKLEAQLIEAKERLNETYYDTAASMQQEALDDELDAYNKLRNNEIDALEKSLDDVETIVSDTLSTIRNNTSVVLGQLESISDQYGIQLSDTLTSPWERGSYAIDTYSGTFLDAGSIFTDELDRIKSHWEALQDQADATARAMIKAVDTEVKSTTSHPETKKTSTSSSNKATSSAATNNKGYLDYEEFFGVPESESRPTLKNNSTASSSAKPSVGQLVTVKQSATNWGANNNYSTIAGWVKGSQFYVRRVDGDEYLISPYATGENYTGWIKLKDLQGYARGTNKINNNQWAWIDEIGEEIVMHAGGDGRLSYLTKGSAVLPSDVSSNLLKLGQADPTDILERSRPAIIASGLDNNGINVDMSFGSLVHVDTVTEDTMPKLKSLIRDEFDLLMKNVNTGLKKYVR